MATFQATPILDGGGVAAAGPAHSCGKEPSPPPMATTRPIRWSELRGGGSSTAGRHARLGRWFNPTKDAGYAFVTIKQ